MDARSLHPDHSIRVACRTQITPSSRVRISERDPIHSHPSKPQLTSQYYQPMAPKRLYSCNVCGNIYTQQNVTRHYREAHERILCLYCDFKSSRRYEYKAHLKKHHPDVDPDVVLGQANSTRKLCMYCDVEWNRSYQYKEHLREHHPNVDPDAVLGEVPGSQRRDKIIARRKAPVSRYLAGKSAVGHRVKLR